MKKGVLRPATLLSNILWYRCFPVNVVDDHISGRPLLDLKAGGFCTPYSLVHYSF